MDLSTLEIMAQRFDRLERELRWWRVFAVCSAGLVGLLAFWGFGRHVSQVSAAVPRVIEAEQFVVRDVQGRARVALSVLDSGPSLTLADDRGQTRLALSLTNDQPILSMVHKQGPSGAILALPSDGSAVLSFHDDSGKPRAAFGVVLKGSHRAATLKIMDENERAHVTLVAPDSREGKPGLTVQDDPKRGSALFTSTFLSLTGDNGMTRAMLSLENGPWLSFADDLGKPRVFLGAVPRQPSTPWVLNFSAADGRTLWAAP